MSSLRRMQIEKIVKHVYHKNPKLGIDGLDFWFKHIHEVHQICKEHFLIDDEEKRVYIDKDRNLKLIGDEEECGEDLLIDILISFFEELNLPVLQILIDNKSLIHWVFHTKLLFTNSKEAQCCLCL